MLERTNQEIKRRTRVATLFPNEASLLRLVSAILSEISEDWETGKIYLTMPENCASARNTEKGERGPKGAAVRQVTTSVNFPRRRARAVRQPPSSIPK